MSLEDKVHAYHLQSPKPDNGLPTEAAWSLGHAVTTNLVDWTECPTAFDADPNNPFDDLQPWTGCAIWHEGRGYLFYTMRGSRHEARVQQIGLATTLDPNHWERIDANPVITPDPAWYADIKRPVPGVVDCRDLCVVKDPKGNGWWGYYATRIPVEPLPASTAIACVWSPDLIRWEHRPPAFIPGNINCIEVPEVFELNGLWYMTCLTGNIYGNRGFWSDPNVMLGTLYAVSERPEGPYSMLHDNVLIGSCEMDTISCRSIVFHGERYLLYTDMQRKKKLDDGSASNGTLSTPKQLKTSGDQLYAGYCNRIESHVNKDLITLDTTLHQEDFQEFTHRAWPISCCTWEYGGQLTGDADRGWGILHYKQPVNNFIFEAIIDSRRAIGVGLIIRAADYHNQMVVSLDFQAKTLDCAKLMEYKIFQRRQVPAELFDKPIFLRLVSIEETLEVYLNDKLYLAFPRYAGLGGRVGFFVDRGRATFSKIKLRMLSA